MKQTTRRHQTKRACRLVKLGAHVEIGCERAKESRGVHGRSVVIGWDKAALVAKRIIGAEERVIQKRVKVVRGLLLLLMLLLMVLLRLLLLLLLLLRVGGMQKGLLLVHKRLLLVLLKL